MKKLIRKGATLQGKGISFLIAERKHTTPKKPRYFLLQKQPHEKYISSLYGEYPEFELEHKGNRYQLTLTDTTGIIVPVKKGVPHV